MAPGLYLHVPFCVRKCDYCAFYSRPAESDIVSAWGKGIERELENIPQYFAPESVFFGGGTPTVLGVAELKQVLELVHSRVGPNRKCYNARTDPYWEWTCEVNPGTLTGEKAKVLREAGVNRLSIGAQSFDEDTLRRLGRIHTAVQTREAVAMAREAGFENIGLDVMYGVPGVSRDSFCSDVEEAMALNPEHISCYCLEIEEGTPFARAAQTGTMDVSEEEQRVQFDWARKRLGEAGWGHYEISNFAKPGRECRQNLLYWSGGEYIGIGPAAHSHWAGVRWGNTASLPTWTREFEERLDPKAKARETLVMGLRRLAGWGREEFCAATGQDYDDLRGREIARLVDEGLLVKEGERIRLSEDALFVSDSVFADLV